MVKLTVYGDPKSSCTQRVLILLEELELEYKLHSVDIQKKQNKDSKFLNLNPFGKVPVVRYGERILFESRAILRYISKNNSDEPEYDFTLDDNHEVNQWLEVESQTFNPIISKIVYEKVFKVMLDKETDTEIIKEQLELFKNVLTIYNEHLSLQKYIAGTEFSIADISHIPYLVYFVNSSKEYKNMLKEYPFVYKWFKRITSREAVKKIVY